MTARPSRVFVLEDDVSVVEIICTALESEGLEVLSAQRVEGAVEAMRSFLPDLALVDVQLPDGDGYGVCRRLRSDPALAKTAVLFLTAKGDVQSRLEGFQAGAQDYIPKPFSMQELLARVRAHLSLRGREETLRRQVEDMAVLERLRQDMLDMILHDLRTPLGTIKISLELVRESGLIGDQEYGRLLKSAENATEFALFMLNDTLDLGAGRLQVEPGPVDLQGMGRKLEQMLSARLQRGGIRLVLALPAEDGAVHSDPALLFRVLLNLTVNAVKFSPRGREVGVSGKVAGGRLTLEVADHGPGIGASEKDKIFEKYYRSPTASSLAPGSGIGLAFCRLAAAALSGRIWVEDQDGGGARFFMEVPARHAAGAAA